MSCGLLHLSEIAITGGLQWLSIRGAHKMGGRPISKHRRRCATKSAGIWNFVNCVESLLLCPQELNQHSQLVLVQHAGEKVQSQSLSVISNVGLRYQYGAELQQRFLSHRGFRASTG